MVKRSKALAAVLAAAILLSAAPFGGFSSRRPTETDSFCPAAKAASDSRISGFVYEAVKSNRIEGATVTLYREDESGNAVVWEDETSGQQNPQVTNNAGRYRWNVPEGKWRVEITKENYKTSCSNWTTVPSEHSDDAVPLVSTAEPEVVGVIEKKDCLTLTFSQYMDLKTIGDDTVIFTKNGIPVDYDIYNADGEISGTNAYVYYAKSVNLEPEKGATALTVKNVKSYTGKTLKGTYSISTKDIPPATKFTIGDVDGDGEFSAGDARIALRASVGVFTDGDATFDFSDNSRMFLAADCDGNGKIESGDARTILRASVGLELKESNSSLITYQNLTKKHDDRTHRIDSITIHHMSGVMTARQCCDYFCETDREVSANYCIGYDGSIALNVEEKYRAWTSSSEKNDMRAITIEVSNDRGDPDWHVSDIALEKLIDLCVDICRRNNIKELVYTGDAYGNLTMHKMFIATDCPGPYLSKKFPYIVKQVNERLAEE